jgi:hypothetical protein
MSYIQYLCVCHVKARSEWLVAANRINFTWLSVHNEQIQGENNDESDDRRDPGDEKHDGDAQHETKQAQPNVVVLQKRGRWRSFATNRRSGQLTK